MGIQINSARTDIKITSYRDIELGLLGARTVESAIQIQTEYAKQAYEGFVAQATKVSELYTRVASDALKPVTTAYANVQVQAK